ncbi:MAG TPA: BlaI/MecI/CopY family transcriptional regulator [Thermoanaerobaculia bacterium]
MNFLPPPCRNPIQVLDFQHMLKKQQDPLSRREREMMNIIFTKGRATATEVMEGMAEPPSYSAVRATLRVLEQKGHLKHQHDGTRYVYIPTVNREKVRLSALDNLLSTFFDGSAANVVATLIERQKGKMSGDELEELSRLIDQARKEGR